MSASKGVAKGTNPVPKLRNVTLTQYFMTFRAGLQHQKDLRRWDARGHGIYCRVADSTILTDNKDGGFGDAAFLARIVDVPLLDDAPPGIAQDRKRQGQLLPQCLGSIWRIDGRGYKRGASCTNLVVTLAVIRQLAEAEWSPIPAVEEQDYWTLCHQLR